MKRVLLLLANGVGALPLLARSGVLDGKRATTYNLPGGPSTLLGKRCQQLAEMGAAVVDEAIARDSNVVTSTGPSTAAEVALVLLEMLTSRENAAKIRELMGFEP